MKIILKFKLIAVAGLSLVLVSNKSCDDPRESQDLYGPEDEINQGWEDEYGVSSTIYCNSTEYHATLEANENLNLLEGDNNWLKERSISRKTINKGYYENGNLKYGKMELQAIVTKTYQSDVWYYFVYQPQEDFEDVLPELFVEGLDCNEEQDITFPYTTNSTKFWHFDAMTAIENHFIDGDDLGWLDQKFEV